MPQIVQIESRVLAVITDHAGYVKARKEADTLSKEYDGLRVADMPMVIQAMTSHFNVCEAIRKDKIDTITGEYHGPRNDALYYETWHSVGSLTTATGLENALSKSDNYTYMQIADDEWNAVGKGTYDGKNVARVHLEDVKKGNVPTAGTPYSSFVRLDKDRPKINGKGQLEYDSFMRDDRVLMIAGSPAARDALANVFFINKICNGEGWSNVGSYHRIHEFKNEFFFDPRTIGRLVRLSNDYAGLGGVCDFGGDLGRFVVVC